MSDHTLMVLFALAWFITLLALAVDHTERNHWKELYEQTRNAVLREGQAQTRRTIRELDAVHQSSLVAWDEWTREG